MVAYLTLQAVSTAPQRWKQESECRTWQDITLYSGRKYGFTVTLGVDITGATIKWVMQQGERSASADVEKPSADGSLTITDVTIGTFSIVIEAGDTLSLQPGPYCHEADIINVSGEPFPVTIGKAVLNDAAASISS